MNKGIFTGLLWIFIWCLATLSILGQCPTGNLVFLSQGQVDSLAIVYPNCDTLTGNIIIGSPTYGSYGIKNLNGFSSVTTILGHLEILSNNALKDFYGFDNLVFIGTHLKIVGNDSLIDLSGLGSLETIGGYCSIGWHAMLNSLEGLDNLNYVGGIFNIYNNSQLSDCSAESICNIFLPGHQGFIMDNLPGCNSHQEIIASCTTPSNEASLNRELKLYPNPAEDIVFIDSSPDMEIQSIQVFNALGGKLMDVFSFENGIDVSVLSSGIYFFKISTQERKHLRRIIIH